MATLPFGAVYLLEQGRSWDEVNRDLDTMLDCGFDLVTLWPAANSWLAAAPDEFIFDATLQMLDLLKRRSMRAIIQLIGQNPSQEYMPDTLLRPEMKMLQPGIICYWANPNHPDVDRAVHEFLRQAVTALKDHPALYAWDVFNEAHVRTDDPWTTKLYQQWLQQKYGDIGKLNYAWYRRFRSFDEIDPADARISYSVWSSLLPVIEYERFRSENLTAICRRYVDYVRELDRGHPVIIDGTSGQMLGASVTGRNNDEFDTARTCDIYGGTFYPKSWGRNLSGRPWELALYLSMPADAARSAGKPYVISELQTHTQSALMPGSEVQPEELANWIWMGIASGANIFQLWRWRPFLHGSQSTGRGLTALDGTPGPRAAAVKALVRVLKKHEALLAAARPVPPAVGLVLSYRSRLFFDAFRYWEPSKYPQLLRGWHRLFWSSGLPIATMEAHYLGAAEQQIPVWVLPSLISVSPAQQEAFAGHVRAGGALIADARLGVVDDMGVVPAQGVPGQCLSELFGCVETEVGGPVDFEFLGEQTQGAFLSQELRLLANAHAVGKTAAGVPLAVTNEVGAGRTLYFGAMMGLTWDDQVTEAQQKFFRDWVLAQAPQTPWAQKPDTVHVAFHQTADRHVVYASNFGSEAAQLRLHNVPAVGRVDELVTGATQRGGAVVELILPGNQTRILTWEKSPAV